MPFLSSSPAVFLLTCDLSFLRSQDRRSRERARMEGRQATRIRRRRFEDVQGTAFLILSPLGAIGPPTICQDETRTRSRSRSYLTSLSPARRALPPIVVRYRTKRRSMDDLSSALDLVWHSSGPRLDIARKAVESLKPTALLQLVALDVANLLDIQPDTLVVDDETRSATLKFGGTEVALRLVNEIDGAFVVYEEGVNVAVVGRPEPTVCRSLANVLAAMQVARDHSDTMAFMPAELRERRMLSFAEEFGMKFKEFRRLVASFPVLWRAL